MKRHLWIWACGILLIASSLRLPQLDVRPMHADEAILADKFGSLLERGSYAYDPSDYHGPLLAYVTLLPAYATGRATYVSLTENIIRVVPALAGIALALTPLLLAGVIGETAAILAALFIAVSPVCVYYSRYYIPEMLLALFTSLLLVALWHASRTGSARAWACVGIAAGASLATKETATIALASAAVAYVFVYRPKLTMRTALALIGGVALVVVAMINPILLLRSFAEYWNRGTTAAGHAHPVHYYFSLLTGLEGRFTEVFLITPALIALFLRMPDPFSRFLKWFAILITAIYCAIPYKTPWCVVSLVFAYALLAGMFFAFAYQQKRAVTVTIVTIGIAHLGWQSWQASIRFSSDPRNQWVYAHTGPDVFEIRDELRKYASAAPEGKNITVAVYTRENLWPLPWYFRDYPNFRWSREVVVAGAAAPIVLASPDMEPALQRKFYEGPPPGQRELYMNLFPHEVYLRPGIEVRGYVIKSLWDKSSRTNVDLR